MVIDCLTIRDKILEDINNISASAMFIQVGDNEESNIYIKQKKQLCEKHNINATHLSLPDNIEEDELIKIIKGFNENSNINGIMVQLPLPSHISEDSVINAITPLKDIDGFTDINKGKLMNDDPTGIIPCTPFGITLLLKELKYDLKGKNVVIAGRSNIVGKPITQILINAGATVACCNSSTDTKVLKNLILNCDLFISAINKPSYFNKEYFGEENIYRLNAITAIDVGIFRVDGKLQGNIDKELYDSFEAITPVPKGVGPLTVACVIANISKCVNLQSK